jgi:hypothetical protein
MHARHTAMAILATGILATTWIWAHADDPRPAGEIPTLLDRITALEARVAKLEKERQTGIVTTLELAQPSPNSKRFVLPPTQQRWPQGEVNGIPYYHMLLGNSPPE